MEHDFAIKIIDLNKADDREVLNEVKTMERIKQTFNHP